MEYSVTIEGGSYKDTEQVGEIIYDKLSGKKKSGPNIVHVLLFH